MAQKRSWSFAFFLHKKFAKNKKSCREEKIQVVIKINKFP
jgi:hypothetical protein